MKWRQYTRELYHYSALIQIFVLIYKINQCFKTWIECKHATSKHNRYICNTLNTKTNARKIEQVNIQNLWLYKKLGNWPCDKKDFALLAVLSSHEIKVKDCISTIIFRQGCSEIIIALRRASSFFDHNLFLFLINFENHIAIYFLPLQFLKCAYALLSNTHPRRCISLQQIHILVTRNSNPFFKPYNQIPQKRILKSFQWNESQQWGKQHVLQSIILKKTVASFYF